MNKSWMITLSRWLLGFVFIAAAVNHFPQFIKDPPMPPAAVALHRALTASGYIFQIVVAVEVIAGGLLLLGVLVPFALILLAPVIVNIFCFHLFLAPGGLPVAIVLAALEIIVTWHYREAFAPLFEARAMTELGRRQQAAKSAQADQT